MSQSRELQNHIVQMDEIRSILNAMKNLALIEVHKLGRYQACQRQAVRNIENAAGDLLAHYPELLSDYKQNASTVVIVAGAERGFCGDYNESLLTALAEEPGLEIIAIGSRLTSKLDAYSGKVLATQEGANVAEEVPKVINQLLETLNSLANQDFQGIRLRVLYHDHNAGTLKHRQLLPPFTESVSAVAGKLPDPVLNMSADMLFSDIVQHYLFAVLHEIFYLALMAENQRRLQHLEGAVQHLDEESIKLHRKAQIYRQEEITEEIEVILLNADK